jgi:hypothetical protein
VKRNGDKAGSTMNGKKQKLELTWIGKENRPKLKPRITAWGYLGRRRTDSVATE